MADDHRLIDGFYGGVIPTKPSVSDHLFGVAKAATLPGAPVDLRGLLPSRSDQGQTGSCGGHAVAKLRHVAVNQWRQSTGQDLLAPDDETFSELWAYYWARKKMGTWPADSGVDNRALLQGMLEQGFVLEEDAPWDTGAIGNDLSGLDVPSDPYYRIFGYERVGAAGMNMPASIAASLQQGRPVLCAIAVYDNFFQSEYAPMPGRARLVGYHDVPIHSYFPDPSAPGGAWFGWRVSWANFGNDEGDAFLGAAYLANSRFCLESWRIT